jgi:hypothetical protein
MLLVGRVASGVPMSTYRKSSELPMSGFSFCEAQTSRIVFDDLSSALRNQSWTSKPSSPLSSAANSHFLDAAVDIKAVDPVNVGRWDLMSCIIFVATNFSIKMSTIPGGVDIPNMKSGFHELIELSMLYPLNGIISFKDILDFLPYFKVS